MLSLLLWEMLVLVCFGWLVPVLSNYVLRATLCFDVVVLIVVIVVHAFQSIHLSLSISFILFWCVHVRFIVDRGPGASNVTD